MSDDEEIHLHVTYASHLDMDEAFCACMRIAIAAGLESAPIGVVTTPGTQNPKYVPPVTNTAEGLQATTKPYRAR
jgi:hypothetical protein